MPISDEMVAGDSPLLTDRWATFLLCGAGYLHGLGGGVAGDAAVEGFGDLLAVSVAAESLLVFGARHKRDFRKNPRHGAFGEDHESGFFDSTVAQTRVQYRERTVERALHAVGESLRLLDAVV